MKRAWTVEFLNDAVEGEFLAVPKDLQARLVRITDLIESYGLENLGMPHVRHLQDKLWEIRGKGKSGDRAGTLCCRGWQASGHSTGICEEVPKDTAGGSRAGIVTNEGD